MDGHVGDEPAAHAGLGVFQIGTERVAANGLERGRIADDAGLNLFLGRPVAGIEAAHEAGLKHHAGLLDGV